ncbi:MAG TPA: 5'/3'-nucleotidase SurE [Tepidisphaeraceae bacterium]|jgi:5'-nucleotidase|nr:5'/3'-nucleotidase SurE [Tepidisphaeraceae bacterium]
MQILLTNDDGIRASGILAMWRELKSLGEVKVIAPETVQSATGHGITLATPLLTNRVKIENGFEGIAVDGRPADCVKLAMNQLLPAKPDLVVSGMNDGANSGINVIYSGTVAAAIEAAFLGCPSIAVSLHLKQEVPTQHAWAAKLGLRMIKQILKAGLSPGQVANVNIPAVNDREEPKGVRIVRQCTRPWVDEYEERTNPRGQKYYWNSSVFKLSTTDDDTDVAALRDKYITVTPLQFDLTEHRLLEKWQQMKWEG